MHKFFTKFFAKNNMMLYFIAAIAGMGGLLMGYDTGVISGALLFIKEEWALSAMSQGWIVSSVLIGAILGALTSGRITDLFGRKAVIITTALIFFVGSIATALADSPQMLMLSRLVIGFAIGITSYAVPLYISEISPDNIRGSLVSLNQLAITVGIVASYLVDQYFAPFAHGWRYMLFVGVVPAAILGLGMAILPNTPRWLVSKNQTEEARKVLMMLDPDNSPELAIEKIINGIKYAPEVGVKALLNPKLRKALIIGIGLMFIQQMTGINTVIYYAPTIFQMTGFQSAVAAISATVGVGIVNVLLTIVSIKLIDKIGRKPLLSIGLIGMIISLFTIGAAFSFTQLLGDALKWVAVGSLLLYIASFAVSLGPVCLLVIAEVYPTRVRGLAMSFTILTNWLCNMIVALSFLPIMELLGKAWTFWIFGIISIVSWFFCYYYVPETKGKSLEEIEALLS